MKRQKKIGLDAIGEGRAIRQRDVGVIAACEDSLNSHELKLPGDVFCERQGHVFFQHDLALLAVENDLMLGALIDSAVAGINDDIEFLLVLGFLSGRGSGFSQSKRGWTEESEEDDPKKPVAHTLSLWETGGDEQETR